MEYSAPTRSKARRYVLLAGVILAAVVMSAFAYFEYKKAVRQEAIRLASEQVAALGGSCWYEEVDGLLVVDLANTPVRDQDIEEFSVHLSRLGAPWLVPLDQSNTVDLRLTHTGITNRAVQALELVRVERLDLMGTQIDDGVVEFLANQHETLRSLNVISTRLSKDAVAALRQRLVACWILTDEGDFIEGNGGGVPLDVPLGRGRGN